MANTFLTRTISSGGADLTKWTWSCWVKRTDLVGGGNNYQRLISNEVSGNSKAWYIRFQNSTQFHGWSENGAFEFTTNSNYRDINGWYHLVVKYDSTQSTQSNRLKVYVNGEEPSMSAITYPSQNQICNFMNTGNYIDIGYYRQGSSEYFYGLMSHMHFTAGYAYDASTFGSTDSTTGEWKINTSPSVTYGSLGFFILKDGNTITDSSPNSNNFSLGGGTLTKTEDCPSNVFATLNPLDTGIAGTVINLANGNNTTMTSSGAGDYGLRSTLGASSGKYYFEIKVNGGNTATIGDMAANLVINMNASSPASNFYGFQRYSDSSTNLYNNGTFVSQNTAMFGGIASGNIISVAVDLTNSKIFLQKNGGGWKNTSGATGDPVNGTNPTFTIAETNKTYGFYCELRDNGDNKTQMNFGNGFFGTTAVSSAGTNASNNGIFEYDVPTGYTALSVQKD